MKGEKMKKVSVALICVFVCLLVVAFVALLVVHADVSITMFADLDECAFIASADGNFSEYSDVLSDENVRGLTYTDFFAGVYDCDTFEFEIFAYEFDSVDSARAYFDEVTGKNSDGLDANFTLSSGLLTSSLVVFDSNRAYVVYAPAMDVSDVAQFLSGVFSLKIK